MSKLKESVSFIRRFVAQPNQIGAIAPSSSYLAKALVRLLAKHAQPVNILELGAGTGAVTEQIIPLLKPDDRVDICEADPKLAQYLQKKFFQQGPLQRKAQNGQARLLVEYIQNSDNLIQYDFIISGLPFNVFSLKDVRMILKILRNHAKPGCVFSYFEYAALRSIKATVHPPGTARKKFRRLSNYLTREISRHQLKKELVLLNFPPAMARHWQFQPIGAN